MLESKYNLVDDSVDQRIPADNDGQVQHGLTFEVKFIGSLDIMQPKSRIEILVAMRRIRYEFKSKNIKKKKVNLIVSVDGVKVVLRKKKKIYDYSWDESQMTLAQDPIFRIFYVSHDSQNLKIFSYIARDKKNNVFHCNVFKSKRKSQAMRIVQTVGQAFEVCHKQSLDNVDAWLVKGEEERSKDETSVAGGTTERSGNAGLRKDEMDNAVPTTKGHDRVLEPHVVVEEPVLVIESSRLQSPLSSPLSVSHQVKLLQRELQQQEQRSQAASTQVVLLQQQLSVETSARTEAQARVQQLLQQNTELLQHLSLLVKHVQELELRTQPHKNSPLGSQDSLLEIALRANMPALSREPNSNSVSNSLVRLDGFRFFSESSDQEKKPERDRDSGQGQDEDQSGGCSPPGNQFLGSLDTPGFRESGIASGYESNTDESDDRDSWGQ
ncbi:carboxyl-terminal PDZ ligand of neuronal nitric oxide synthase protein-like isoform X1 [Carassius gibelio]|uniref:carboxyl-terminal PDZ ligand of neuronal nitric oxide synthase protein-like isoform X1 n=1 Tax=Carassius gibelio TaxID=101364 RepID=UPI002277D065|nr:carboxyl-terminal PDZ ligand of neuronal nitric oxide synthase protein-like isoform X1 [Carassius gibelio]